MKQILEYVAGNGAHLVLGACGVGANRILTELAQLTGVEPKPCLDDFGAAQTVMSWR